MLWTLSSATCRALYRGYRFVLGTGEKELKYTRRDVESMSGERRKPRVHEGKGHRLWSPMGLGSRPCTRHIASLRHVISFANWKWQYPLRRVSAVSDLLPLLNVKWASTVESHETSLKVKKPQRRCSDLSSHHPALGWEDSKDRGYRWLGREPLRYSGAQLFLQRWGCPQIHYQFGDFLPIKSFEMFCHLTAP